MDSKAAMMTIVREVIPEVEAILKSIDQVKDEFPALQMAAIYIDQALNLLSNEIASLDRMM